MPEADRHLVLVQTAGWQEVGDFHALKARIDTIAPEITVFIASNDIASSSTRKAAARRPTLVFSPIRLLKFKPDRGRLYVGRPMSKLDEMRTLSVAGLPVPHFEPLTPTTTLDRERFGPLTVVKPSDAWSSFGKGITLHRTETVRFRPITDFPTDHPGSQAPMIAQRFVDCGYPMTCRVLTFFGEPIFTYLRRSTRRMALPAEADCFDYKLFMPSPPGVEKTLTREPDMLALARRAYAVMPDVALQACDILRCEATGALSLLEINPGGGTWMFSSPRAPSYRKALGIDDLFAPFDALTVMARLLVERTRAEAE